MNKILLSVIVPTKNRYFYLTYLIKYFHSIKSNEIELIVQDNSDEVDEKESFINFLESNNDTRVKYNYSNENLSVIENSDRALLNARGEYITFIGDDDIFSVFILDLIKEAKEKKIDAILPLKASYNWPDIKSRTYGDKLSGKFTQTNATGKQELRDVERILEKVLNKGATDILNLPRVYHGIVKLSILKNIYSDSGSFFPGPSPDMANAVALCKYVNKYIIIDIPFVISGHSVKSTGGQGADGKHFGEIKKIKHLPKETAENWTPSIPFYWSGNTIYAESVIQALKRMKMNDFIKIINLNYLYAQCLVFDANYKDRISKTIRIARKKMEVSMLKIYFYYCLIWCKRIWFHLHNNIRYILPKSTNKNIFLLGNIKDVAELNDEMIFNFYQNRKTFI